MANLASEPLDDPAKREYLLPCLCSATILMVLHWLSAALAGSLWFDYPGMDRDGRDILAILLLVIIGFQVALWFANAEYLVICRRLGVKHKWMWLWVFLFLSGLWFVPSRVVEDGSWPLEGDSFLAMLDGTIRPAVVLLLLFLTCHLPVLFWFMPPVFLERLCHARPMGKLWRAELRFTIRSMIFMSTIVSLVVAAEVQLTLFSYWASAWVFVACFLFSVLVKLTAMEQSSAWKANTIQLAFWICTGILFYFMRNIWNDLHPLFQSLLGMETVDALPVLFIGYYFGRLVIVLVYFLDRFPANFSSEFFAVQVSRRVFSGLPAIALLLLILVGTQVSWHVFSSRYHPSVLILMKEKRWEKAMVVARLMQLHRSVQPDELDKKYRASTAGRCFLTQGGHFALIVTKAISRDPRWRLLVSQTDVAALDTYWVHDYPQDNPEFFEWPHSSPLIDLDEIHPGVRDWSVVVEKQASSTLHLHGGRWSGEMVEAVLSAGIRTVYLHEPGFDQSFASDHFLKFGEVVVVCESFDPVIEQPNLYVAMIRNGVTVWLPNHDVESVRQQIRQVPELHGRVLASTSDRRLVTLSPEVEASTGQ